MVTAAEPLLDISIGDAEPRRLHSATILIVLVREAPSILLGIPALLAIGARADLWLVLTGAVTVLLFTGAFRWLAWSRFTYVLTDDAVVIESGVFSRNRRTISYERIADVGIERRPLQRLFGLATVNLETGGSGSNEGALNSVSIGEAERLRHLLRSRRVDADQRPSIVLASSDSATAPDTGAPLFAMSPRRVLIWGLFNFSLVWIAVAFGAVQYLDRAFGVDARLVWDAVQTRSGSVRSLPTFAVVGAIILATAVMLCAGIAAGLIRTTLREHGFTLAEGDSRLRRTRGLFTRSETIISLPRVQLAAIDDGPVRRRFGWARLRAQVLGGQEAGGRQDLAPCANADEVDRVLRVLRLHRLPSDELQAVAAGHRFRALLRQVGIPALLIFGASSVTPLALLATPLLLPLIGRALLERRHHRYGFRSGLLQVQRGVLRRTTWIMPLSRAPIVSIHQSCLQRRLGLATVMIDTAGGGWFDGPNIHDLKYDAGRRLVDRLRRP